MSDALDVGSTAATADKGMYRQLLEEKIAEARLQIERLTADIHEATLAAHDIPADDEHDSGRQLEVERRIRPVLAERYVIADQPARRIGMIRYT